MNIALHRTPLLHLYTRVYFAIKRQRRLLRPLLLILTTIIGKKPLKIVLADDDIEDREVFLEVLEEIAPHVEVIICEDGTKLMNHLYKKDVVLPDLIFLDLHMPKKDGNECLKDIRTDEAFKDIPIIIYSTSRNEEHIKSTFVNGANFYFPKCESFGELRLIMNKIFNFHWNQFMKPAKSRFVLTAK
jgi:CheY-like chemotaxis protein